MNRCWEAAQARTTAAMEGSAAVVFSVFAHVGWRGVAALLLRRPDGSYEAVAPAVVSSTGQKSH